MGGLTHLNTSKPRPSKQPAAAEKLPSLMRDGKEAWARACTGFVRTAIHDCISDHIGVALAGICWKEICMSNDMLAKHRREAQNAEVSTTQSTQQMHNVPSSLNRVSQTGLLRRAGTHLSTLPLS